jgi:hypothetical protein
MRKNHEHLHETSGNPKNMIYFYGVFFPHPCEFFQVTIKKPSKIEDSSSECRLSSKCLISDPVRTLSTLRAQLSAKLMSYSGWWYTHPSEKFESQWVIRMTSHI